MANIKKKDGLSKEAHANAKAGMNPKAPSQEEVKVLTADEQRAVDLAQIKASIVGTPARLEAKLNIQQQHAELIRDLQIRNGEIKQLLSPGRDVVAKGLAPKLSDVEIFGLRNEMVSNDLLLQKLGVSHRVVTSQFIQDSKADIKSLRLEILRGRVKSPKYYKRYGKFIVPAWKRVLETPMTEVLRDKLKAVRSVAPKDRSDAIVKFLSAEFPDLYIRVTGSKDLKDGYLSEFGTLLARWDPRKAIIK